VNLEPDVLPEEEDELDDPPLTIEFPLEVNRDPDVLPEEEDDPRLEENETPALF